MYIMTWIMPDGAVFQIIELLEADNNIQIQCIISHVCVNSWNFHRTSLQSRVNVLFVFYLCAPTVSATVHFISNLCRSILLLFSQM